MKGNKPLEMKKKNIREKTIQEKGNKYLKEKKIL